MYMGNKLEKTFHKRKCPYFYGTEGNGKCTYFVAIEDNDILFVFSSVCCGGGRNAGFTATISSVFKLVGVCHFRRYWSGKDHIHFIWNNSVPDVYLIHHFQQSWCLDSSIQVYNLIFKPTICYSLTCIFLSINLSILQGCQTLWKHSIVTISLFIVSFFP